MKRPPTFKSARRPSKAVTDLDPVESRPRFKKIHVEHFCQLLCSYGQFSLFPMRSFHRFLGSKKGERARGKDLEGKRASKFMFKAQMKVSRCIKQTLTVSLRDASGSLSKQPQPSIYNGPGT